MPSTQNSNPVVTITNASGVDVEIFDVYNPNPDGKKGIYSYTSLGTLNKGATAKFETLRFASQLQAVYSGSVAAINKTYYEKFPVAVLAVSILDDSTLNQTLTADSRTGMEQAFLFARYSAANANSKLTQQFVTALNAQDQSTAVNSFFSGSANFGKASMAAWSAIITWESQFLSAWQGPYYLYQNDTAAKTIQLIAVVNIVSSEQENSAKLYIAKQDGTYSSSSQNTDIVQAGDGSINELSVGSSTISLTLTPVWMNISTVNADGSPQYALGGAMSGTVNSIQVMGTGQKITVPSGSGSSSSSSSWYEEFSKLYSLTLSTVGMLTSMGMLFIMFKQWKAEKTQKANDCVNQSGDPKANKTKIELAQKESDHDVDGEMRPVTQKQSASTQTDIQLLSADSKAITTIRKRIEARRAIGTTEQELTELLRKAPPSDETEDVVAEIMESREALANGRVEEAFEQLSQAGKTVVEMSQAANSGMTEAQKADAQAIKDALEDSQKIQDELQVQQEQQQERQDAGAKDDIPKQDLDGGADVDAFHGDLL